MANLESLTLLPCRNALLEPSSSEQALANDLQGLTWLFDTLYQNPVQKLFHWALQVRPRRIRWKWVAIIVFVTPVGHPVVECQVGPARVRWESSRLDGMSIRELEHERRRPG